LLFWTFDLKAWPSSFGLSLLDHGPFFSWAFSCCRHFCVLTVVQREMMWASLSHFQFFLPPSCKKHSLPRATPFSPQPGFTLKLQLVFGFGRNVLLVTRVPCVHFETTIFDLCTAVLAFLRPPGRNSGQTLYPSHMCPFLSWVLPITSPELPMIFGLFFSVVHLRFPDS